MKWRGWYFLILLGLCLTGCGTDTIYSTPAGPPIGYGPGPSPVYNQAPPPPNYQVPPGGSSYPPPSGSFVPQMPPGYPPQYYPFLPIDYYMRNNAGMSGYWTSFWGSWVNYAQAYGYQTYDFNAFWYSFCPQQWQGTQWSSFYVYMNQNFYSWMSPQVSLPSSCDPGSFWSNYYGYPYASGGCDGGCY